MGYLPLAKSERDVGIRAHLTQRFYINPADFPPGPVGGSMAGFHYPLPALNRLRPIVQIRAYTRDEADRIILHPNYDTQTPRNYGSWFLTLREPDGTYILDHAPLIVFTNSIGNSPSPTFWLKRFNIRVFPDPKQSFVMTPDDSLTHNLCLEFTYV
jgi:hypothetical protein